MCLFPCMGKPEKDKDVQGSLSLCHIPRSMISQRA